GEVAEMLDSTVESVTSALKRARASLRRRLKPPGGRRPAPAAGSAAEKEAVAGFVRAYKSGDVDSVVALLTAALRLSMPPIPLEYHGRDAVAHFFGAVIRRRTHDFVPTRANGQPALGMYLRASKGGLRHGTGLFVLTLAGDRICAMTRFDNSVLPWFGLPKSLPD